MTTIRCPEGLAPVAANIHELALSRPRVRPQIPHEVAFFATKTKRNVVLSMTVFLFISTIKNLSENSEQRDGKMWSTNNGVYVTCLLVRSKLRRK